MADILDIEPVQNWLRQFMPPDTDIARHLLRSLRYVSFDEFETWIQTAVLDTISEIENAAGGKTGIAIFPVTKPTSDEFNEGKEEKDQADSGGRIAHALKNLERRLPKNVELLPRLESMRARRVRHIIYVDDLVGTGKRFIRFWRDEVSGSVKSWSSFNWTRVWLLSFVGHEQGIRNIVRSVHAIEPNSVRVSLRISDSFIDSEIFHKFLQRNGPGAQRNRGRKGFGALLTPVVFQHGCPNNAPTLLWKGEKKTWRALFPNRSIPENLYPLFQTDVKAAAGPQELWMARNYSLALRLLEDFEAHPHGHDRLMVLALLANGKKLERIRSIMVWSDREFHRHIQELEHSGLIDPEANLTEFGRDILKRFGRKGKTYSPEVAKPNYYPASFLGLQRDV